MDVKRLNGAVDANLMKSSGVMVVGIGGASGLIEDLVRAGVGKITAIDFDIVDSSNIVTQGYGHQDIGRLKVDALADRLLSINPDLEYSRIPTNLFDLADGDIQKIVDTVDLLLFMTDDFYCQARGNRISLKHQKPSVFAMMYYKARCAEISFTIPGITPACHRCCTAPRYLAYKNGYKNDVTSQGSTIMQAHYLNAAIGMICLAILNRDNPGCELGGWFSQGREWERNLVQLRLSPNYGVDEETTFQRMFKGNDRIFTFDSNWIRVEPDRPPKHEPCPDCGGTGDLRTAAGRISSTFPVI